MFEIDQNEKITAEEHLEYAEKISDAEVEAAVARAIEGIDVDLDTLKRFAARGRFDTDAQRRVWLAISGIGYV